MPRILLTILYHAAAVAALNTFDTQCTIPSQSVGYVSGGNSRSTLDIIWSSVATILICTYTVLHLNVPEQRDGRDPGWSGNFKWGCYGFWRDLKWMCLTLILPELYTACALSDYRRAHKLRKRFKEILKPNQLNTWTLRHMHFADMGGFAIRVVSNAKDGSHDAEDSADDRSPTQQGSLIHLRGRHVFELVKLGWLHSTAPISEDEILDRAKSNSFTKAVFFVQLGYFCLGVIARAAQHLPISLLELGTLSYAALSAVAGLLQLNKPKSVGNVVVLKQLRPDDTDAARVSEIICGKKDQTKVDDATGEETTDEPLRIFLISGPESRVTTGIKSESAGMAVLFISGCFGAIHLAAWNFAFPTHVEQWLWRSASIMVSSGLLVAFVGVIVVVVVDEVMESISSSVYQLWESGAFIFSIAGALIWTIAYLLARLFLIIEMFRGLFYLPPQAFQSTWTANLPGFG